jgi:hypothetical protein
MFHDVPFFAGFLFIECSFFSFFWLEIHSLFGSSNNYLCFFFFLFFFFPDELVFFFSYKMVSLSHETFVLDRCVRKTQRMIGHCCREVDIHTAARFQVVQPSALPESAGASPSPVFFRTQVLD